MAGNDADNDHDWEGEEGRADDDNPEAALSEAPSRSARKRDAQAVRALGVRLTELTAAQQHTLSLPESLQRALDEFRRLRARGARKRQLQYIAGLMRELDTSPISEALDQRDGRSAAARYELHYLERWRDRLLADRQALTEYIDEHPEVDRQPLRQAVDNARRSARALASITPGAGEYERRARNARRDARALFALLRDHGQGAD
ncbi:MAG: ribosome biogenesis factor YjgA [Pseudomonadota bacterium]